MDVEDGSLLAFAVLAAEVACAQLTVDVRQMNVRFLLLVAALLLLLLLFFLAPFFLLLLLFLAPFLLLFLLLRFALLVPHLVAVSVPAGLGPVGERLAMTAAGPAQLAFRIHFVVVVVVVPAGCRQLTAAALEVDNKRNTA